MKHICLFLLCLLPLTLLAGKNDTLFKAPEPIHWNVIKLNLTPMLLWSFNNVTLSYERILGPRQSVTIALGYLEYPTLFKDTIAGLVNVTSRQKRGINVGLEYRFYLMKRNRRPIPDGLYLAPYASFYGYSFKNNLDILETTVDTGAYIKGRFYCFNLGVELGYQFVFWKRFTLDLVLFGPSVSYYGGDLSYGVGLNPDEIKKIDQEILDEIKQKYPFVRSLFTSNTLVEKGKLDLFSLGFRYMIQIGFHF
ncbi:MAG: DUF3575 domain-containing protein [Bacteroidales bacterium]|nr:DUF3575 domain-containing protein [Bacteroidales bacterium]